MAPQLVSKQPTKLIAIFQLPQPSKFANNSTVWLRIGISSVCPTVVTRPAITEIVFANWYADVGLQTTICARPFWGFSFEYPNRHENGPICTNKRHQRPNCFPLSALTLWFDLSNMLKADCSITLYINPSLIAVESVFCSHRMHLLNNLNLSNKIQHIIRKHFVGAFVC